MSQSASDPKAASQGEVPGPVGEEQKALEPDRNGIKGSEKRDLSNGFENRMLDYERSQSILPPTSRPQQYPAKVEVPTADYPVSQAGMYPAATRRQSVIGQPPEERHLLPVQQQYPSDKPPTDRANVSQTATQTLPIQSQPHFVPDYAPDQTQYPQARGQFEVRSQMYSQQAAQYNDRVGYVTRDVTYRDSALYAHTQSPGNPVFTGGSGGYVTVQHSSQLPSQSASPQPPFYSSVIMTAQPSTAPQSYGQFSGPPQYSYSQYPQAMMNPVTYHPHAMYPGQPYSQQTSPNPQRYSQDMTQYQAQPIIQPIAQNVIASDRGVGRGPKPMVPPRVNSKITCDSVLRKPPVADGSCGKSPGTAPPKYEPPCQGVATAQEGSMMVTGAPASTTDSRVFLAPVNQPPRTRQDGLFVDSNGDPSPREKMVDTMANECALYVSRAEHRKSISVDVTSSFPRRNDTITFTFPGDVKPNLGEKKWPEGAQTMVNDQRRVEPVLRVSSMTFDGRDSRKVAGPERKPEWGSVSPNQRSSAGPAENRRSDYFEEHRRSPMPIDPKRMEDVRRSPMPFMPVRDPSAERAAQKSPSFANQNFEKTRQELAIWAEQRQRHDSERNIHQGPVFTTSPRSRNQSEERRESRVITEERAKDTRVPQAAFQPIPNISQSTIMEQRRHLRHVSADLTKHMELSRKDFDEQPTTGSVANLMPTISTTSSQRASPNLCHQFPALSEAKLDTKTLLTVVTDFTENPQKTFEQSDHIIHSHKKSHTSANLSHSKSQAENLQAQSESTDKTQDISHSQQQFQNQQSLDILSQKLSQFERQQSDLQARLQCLQNQNHLLDQVAQYQHQQSDLQVRFQCLQDRQAAEKTLRQDFQQKTILSDVHHLQLNSLPEHVLESLDKSSEHHSHRLSSYLPASFQSQICQADRLSPRVQHESSESERSSQIPLPSNSQFERSDGPRGSLQYRLVCQADVPENASSGAATATSGSTVSGVTFAGTLKKVPPEKPPRTSLIVQSPEAEV